jgi:hypothetical protein
MQIWLLPVDFNGTPSQSPLCAVLIRILHSLENSNCDEDILESIRRLALIAARVSPGNLREYAGNLDSEQYGYEVVRTEQDRLDLPRSLSRVLQSINEFHNEEVEWCLPIIDPELHLAEAVDFVNQIKAQRWLSTYVICDIDLKRFFAHGPYGWNITFLSETEFVAMNVVSEAMDTLRLKSDALSLPSPIRPSSEWNLGIALN